MRKDNLTGGVNEDLVLRPGGVNEDLVLRPGGVNEDLVLRPGLDVHTSMDKNPCVALGDLRPAKRPIKAAGTHRNAT